MNRAISRILCLLLAGAQALAAPQTLPPQSRAKLLNELMPSLETQLDPESYELLEKVADELEAGDSDGARKAAKAALKSLSCQDGFGLAKLPPEREPLEYLQALALDSLPAAELRKIALGTVSGAARSLVTANWTNSMGRTRTGTAVDIEIDNLRSVLLRADPRTLKEFLRNQRYFEAFIRRLNQTMTEPQADGLALSSFAMGLGKMVDRLKAGKTLRAEDDPSLLFYRKSQERLWADDPIMKSRYQSQPESFLEPASVEGRRSIAMEQVAFLKRRVFGKEGPRDANEVKIRGALARLESELGKPGRDKLVNTLLERRSQNVITRLFSTYAEARSGPGAAGAALAAADGAEQLATMLIERNEFDETRTPQIVQRFNEGIARDNKARVDSIWTQAYQTAAIETASAAVDIAAVASGVGAVPAMASRLARINRVLKVVDAAARVGLAGNAAVGVGHRVAEKGVEGLADEKLLASGLLFVGVAGTQFLKGPLIRAAQARGGVGLGRAAEGAFRLATVAPMVPSLLYHSNRVANAKAIAAEEGTNEAAVVTSSLARILLDVGGIAASELPALAKAHAVCPSCKVSRDHPLEADRRKSLGSTMEAGLDAGGGAARARQAPKRIAARAAELLTQARVRLKDSLGRLVSRFEAKRREKIQSEIARAPAEEVAEVEQLLKGADTPAERKLLEARMEACANGL